MQNVVLSTRNIDDLINDVANKVVEKMELWNAKSQAPQPEADELLTVQQAAQFLSLSVPTIYGLISRGKLPTMKRSKRCYFSKLELMNYLKAGRRKSDAEIEQEAEAYLLNNKKGLNNGK